MLKAYIPERGDAVWVNFNPQAGHKQAGRRPALVLSPTAYNRRLGLALLCPITNQSKGYPFEVLLPDNLPVTGTILSDHIKNLDWRARNVEFICKVPYATVQAVLEKINTLL
ncbi:MAG: endoribonuclease MazF [Abitibacteriaceae bacterium]|nr:endoribonuclease MazF [Abditibacteriaceae bacterium]